LIITRQWLLDSARKEAERHFNPDTLLCLIPRETVWYAITLLASDRDTDRHLGNRILEQLTIADGTHTPCTLLALENRLGDRLTPTAHTQIRKNLSDTLDLAALTRYSDGNVNHPIAAYVHLILSGERLGEPVYARLGRNLLRQFHDTIALRQHGGRSQSVMAEYNSPTYTALTLWFLSMAAEWSRDPDTSALAHQLERSVWREVALHWHPPTHQFIGPFSRAYAEDSHGSYSALHCTLGYASGEDLALDPDLPRFYEHPSALIQNALIAFCPFHLSPDLKKLAFDKPLPCTIEMNTYGESFHELAMDASGHQHRDIEGYVGGWSRLVTHMNREAGIGTASRPYVDGVQTDGFSVRYRIADRIESSSSVRSLYTRFRFNGDTTPECQHWHISGNPVHKDLYPEEGRLFTFQHKNLVLGAYIPKRAGSLRQVSQLRCDYIFSNDMPIQQLETDIGPVTPETIVDTQLRWILIKEHKTLLVLLPLPSSDHPVLQFSREPRRFRISQVLYTGPKRPFGREELARQHAGFVCITAEHHTQQDEDRVREKLSRVVAQQTTLPNGVLFSYVKWGSDEMIFTVDPIREQILQRSWNDRAADCSGFEIKTDTQSSMPLPTSLMDPCSA
jgi:hypothetical protein